MEQKQKRPAMTSVPQFGAWDQNAPGATDYSMVFTQARANKKHQKTNLTEIKPESLGNEGDPVNANHDQPRRRRHSRNHASHSHEESVVMEKRKILTFINCCIRP